MNDALRILANVEGDRRFFVNDGQIVSNLYELPIAIRTMNLETFAHHVNDERNDFCNWVNEVLGDGELADNIKEIREPDGVAIKLENRLNQLNHLLLADNLIAAKNITAVKTDVEPLEPITKKIEKIKKGLKKGHKTSVAAENKEAIVKVSKKKAKARKKSITVSVTKSDVDSANAKFKQVGGSATAGELRKKDAVVQEDVAIEPKKVSILDRLMPKVNAKKADVQKPKISDTKSEVKVAGKSKIKTEQSVAQVYKVMKVKKSMKQMMSAAKQDMQTVFSKEAAKNFWQDLKTVGSFFTFRRR